MATSLFQKSIAGVCSDENNMPDAILSSKVLCAGSPVIIAVNKQVTGFKPSHRSLVG